MPKRAATPPIDDGAKYLTVVYPYPSRPNMEFESHRKLFAQWVAACIGSRYLRAFYHKPTSPGSILLEIDESLPDFKQILGAHKWSEFLTSPQGDDTKHVSRVFYCTYNSDRLVQKNGWKRIDIKDSWFKSKGPSKFASPYPPTRWCDIPKVGNVIQNDLCRPLPGGNFPPPPSAPVPVVGTPEWLEYKRQQEAKVPVVRTWTRETPPESLHSAHSSGVGSAPTSQSPPSHTTPAAQPAPRWAWANVAAGSAGAPPGLLRANSAASSQGSSTSGSGSARATPLIRTASPLAPQSACSSTSGSGSDNQLLSPTDGVHNNQVAVAARDVEGALNALSLEGEEDPDDDFYYSIADATSPSDDTPDAPRGAFTIVPATSVKESLWGDYVEEDDDDDEDPEDNDLDLVKAAKKKPGLCRAHNRVCKKGICKIYAAQLKEEEKKKREEERRQQREGRRKSTKKDAAPEDASTPPSRSGSSTPARAPPPHLRAGAPAPAARQVPAHLRRGAAPASAPPPSPVSPISPPALVSRAPSNNSARSASSGGWGSVPSDPWGPPPANGNAAPPPRDAAPSKNAATTKAPANAVSSAPTPQREWGAWGRAPSIAASSVQRNNDSWSVSARDKDDDAQSVATSGWGTKSDRAGPWGSTASVRAAGPSSKGAPKISWAEEMDEADGRSVAGSTLSASTARTWGNVSAGPW